LLLNHPREPFWIDSPFISRGIGVDIRLRRPRSLRSCGNWLDGRVRLLGIVFNVPDVPSRWIWLRRLSTSSKSSCSEFVVVIEHGEIGSESLDSKSGLRIGNMFADNALEFQEGVRFFGVTRTVSIDALFTALSGLGGQKGLGRFSVRFVLFLDVDSINLDHLLRLKKSMRRYDLKYSRKQGEQLSEGRGTSKRERPET